MDVNIVVCDDDIKIHQELSYRFVDIEVQSNILLHIAYFENPCELVHYMEGNNEINIAIIDVDMPKLNGFEVAEKLRQRYKKNAILIFLTSMDHSVFESFAYQPFRFIRKSKLNMEFQNAVFSAIEQIKMDKNRETLVVRSEYESVKIMQSDIYYLEYMSRKIECHMKDHSIYYMNDTMKSTYAVLDETLFKWAHSGCIVNLQYIKKIEKDCIVLDDDSKILVSRAKKEQLKKDFLQFWGNKI